MLSSRRMRVVSVILTGGLLAACAAASPVAAATGGPVATGFRYRTVPC
jgi:hypothetical protein